ncbi:hypothetical protein MTR67_014916 [Solanum verrucosum]|uniref:Reverse transcriptase Ty1/copia-type domain-containing protein n=1 Tax=Solanum verrucosum TaxID=315347 RepID=A0AAF0TJD9_SOLVR|nr:hypothetical protein MTR67_014916 [Solanum verrucosum]
MASTTPHLGPTSSSGAPDNASSSNGNGNSSSQYLGYLWLEAGSTRLSHYVEEFIKQLGTRFSIKDFGDLNFFLGVEVIRSPLGLFLSQQKYLCDILDRTSMADAKPVRTPIVCGSCPGSNAVQKCSWKLAAGDHDDRSSTIAYVMFFGCHPISWSSKKQRVVARSLTEAEYRVIASTTVELCWVRNLLNELSVTLAKPPVIYCDNLGAIYVCANPVFHSRMKHIELDYHFVRKLV